MKSNVVIISVVRDGEMYDHCVRRNPFANGHTLCPLDNTRENKTIPVRYNEFLNSYDFAVPAWLIFCHEDFELKQAVDPLLEPLDKNVLYGPIGARTDVRWHLLYTWRLIGQIVESTKDGSNERHIGTPYPTGTPVETFDCQCLIIHSDLIKRTGLRFDENLSFDLYIEDFCINAKENHGVPSQVLAVECQHWSGGTVRERYYHQEAYLNKKHPHCCYTGTSSYSIGKPGVVRRLNEAMKRGIRRFLSAHG